VTSTLIVEQRGLASTVQDLGRLGLAHLGVPSSGAVDPRLAVFVNRLVGNPPGAAVIETCGRLVLRAEGALLVATSTEAAPISLRSGDVLHLDGGLGRVWHYLAVAGGIDVQPVLGSRATDTLSGLGPSPLADGDRLPVGSSGDVVVTTDHAPLPAPNRIARLGEGPRLDWFDGSSFERLVAEPWVVATASRVGVRLRGLALHRRTTTELPSEGLVRGAIQVPPDGQPMMMLADHPTTGGYPVIAVVDPDDVAVVAQVEAGGTLRFASGRR
jgi:biotin-dependent carboxylase-like uncharacterized protein